MDVITCLNLILLHTLGWVSLVSAPSHGGAIRKNEPACAFGLLRMFRLARISEEFLDRFVSEGFHMLFRVIAIFLTVLWLNHLIGLSMVGRYATDGVAVHFGTAGQRRRDTANEKHGSSPLVDEGSQDI